MRKVSKLLKIIIILIISFMFIANTNIVTCTETNKTEQTDSKNEDDGKQNKVNPPKAKGDSNSRSTSDKNNFTYTGQEAETIDENIENANKFIEKRRKPIGT